MSYLAEFKDKIKTRNFQKFFQLWEEYCTSDEVDHEELIQLLRIIKESDFAKLFGQFAESALPIWSSIKDPEASFEVLKLIVDLETTNSKEIGDLILKTLKERYGNNSNFNEYLRLAGLRSQHDFQGSLSKYELLDHMKLGNCVYRPGGWGVGEIMDVSFLREQLSVEFENAQGLKHFTFANAFKSLVPLKKDHFLAQRFSNPDKLEELARQDPLTVIRLLLRDLGPKTGIEIKEELCDLVIPEKDWAKWWQGVRAKLKKNTLIAAPEESRGVFSLRESEVSHDILFNRALQQSNEPSEVIQSAYSFVRDLPSLLKKTEVTEPLKQKMLDFLREELSPSQRLQILIFLETFLGVKDEVETIKNLITSLRHPVAVVNEIAIIPFKRQVLQLMQQYREDWVQIYLDLFQALQQNPLQIYLLSELNQGEVKPLLVNLLRSLKTHPAEHPHLVVWYFQQLMGSDKEELPFHDQEGIALFFEAFLILLPKIEHNPDERDLVKKMISMVTKNNYELIRNLFAFADEEYVKEYLLLFAKCHCFNEHEKQILRSLAEVAKPALATVKGEQFTQAEGHIIWTTEEGYLKTQQRLQQIGNVEMIENAKEVEAARALGDLRENSEYKFAVEKRNRLQNELKVLSKQLNHARIITPEDIFIDRVGVGNIVALKGKDGQKTYIILGPWDANPDANIISFQSQFAQILIGKKVGESFEFRDQLYHVEDIRSYLEKQ